MKIIECPRDAMQGIKTFIPTEQKITYINQLLKVGFDTVDFGSFVSAKAIPQMQDTVQVLESLDTENNVTKLLAIIANTRGAEEAAKHDKISYLGFPLSISETFQQRNTNKSIPEALNILDEIQTICLESQKELVCYLSMGFGNPYGDPYDVTIVSGFADILVSMGIKTISLADTIGIASPDQISTLFTDLTNQFSGIELGVHLHAVPGAAKSKIEAAWQAGCRRFDGALKGFGGCPMAKDDLTGNLPTEEIIAYMGAINEPAGINHAEFNKALQLADKVFAAH